jgi:ABC-type multidrug transport system fused ATPase/permease subunit
VEWAIIESLTQFTQYAFAGTIYGLEQIVYATFLVVMIMVRPTGVIQWCKTYMPDGWPYCRGIMLLEVKNLSKNFGGLKAVSGLTFNVEAGEIYGQIGPNGAGKTTAST